MCIVQWQAMRAAMERILLVLELAQVAVEVWRGWLAPRLVSLRHQPED
jgi:hypothetical protein